jgi:hypothetical protein
MAVLKKWTKDPDAVLDYSIDWSTWLQTGDEIASATWTVPTGIVLDSQDESTTRTVAWLSSGTAGVNYDLGCLITTTSGRLDERTITIKVRER